MHIINERVALVMIPYLRPDFPPLSLALLKGILNYEKIPNTTIDLNIYIKDHFNSEELADLENFCSESICIDQKKTIKNGHELADKILTKEENLQEGLTNQQIAILKREYAPFKGKTISAARARQLMNILDRFKDQELEKLAKPDIPFVSSGSQSK